MNTTLATRSPAGLLRRLDKEFIRYLTASVIALLVDLGLFSLGLRILGLTWPTAATLGFCLGIATIYLLSIRWVFRTRKLSRRPKLELATFAGIGVTGLGFTQGLLWLSIDQLGIQPELARIAAAGATFLLNYVIRAALLFRKAPISL